MNWLLASMARSHRVRHYDMFMTCIDGYCPSMWRCTHLDTASIEFCLVLCILVGIHSN